MAIYWSTMQMHPVEEEDIQDIFNFAKEYHKNKDTTYGRAFYEKLSKAVYKFYTDNFLTTKFVDSFLRDTQSDKAKAAQYESYKNFINNSVYPSMDSAAMKLGFELDDNPGWKSYKKNIVGFDGPNYKFYLTVTNGLDFKTYNDNITRFALLLGALAKAPIQGTYSIKFAKTYLGMLKHKDTIVIHFKWPTDAQAIWNAVNSVGLKLYPREDLHRIELGLDKQKGNFDSSDDSSDSQLTATEFLNTALSGVLSESAVSQPIQKDLIFSELMRAQFEAPHRKNIHLNYR